MTTNAEITFNDSCEALQDILQGQSRAEMLDQLCSAKTLKDALAKLRSSMRAHRFSAGSGNVNLHRIVRTLDDATKRDGFNVLIDWDGKANCWVEETIPINVLDYFARSATAAKIDSRARRSLAILLDYYLLYVVALLAMRVGDRGHAPENVERVNGLITELQGPSGSGQRNVDDVGTLVLIATSHFEPDETAYERLIRRIRSSWDETQQVKWSLGQAAVLGGHLRHGFHDLYVKDLGLMRADNTSDYPCLCIALLTLMRAYARMHERGLEGPGRQRLVEGILNGLTPDARAFIGKAPAPLADFAAEQAEFCSTFMKYRESLFKEFEIHRPSFDAYSALAFSFNFPHNLVKAMVVDAIFKAEPSDVPVDCLFSGLYTDTSRSKALALTLSEYARRAPDTIRGRPVAVICYDPALGLRTYARTLSILNERVMAPLPVDTPRNQTL